MLRRHHDTHQTEFNRPNDRTKRTQVKEQGLMLKLGPCNLVKLYIFKKVIKQYKPLLYIHAISPALHKLDKLHCSSLHAASSGLQKN